MRTTLKRALLLISMGLCLVAGVARTEADTAASEQLITQLQSIQQLQGDFEQLQYGPDSDALVSTSRGHFKLLRPGYFSWEINSPDSQLIIADLDYLWHFDRDLETVTRRPVSGSETMTPLQVLGGDTEVLTQRFNVQAESAQRYKLTPLETTDPGFKSLTLLLKNEQLSGMEVLDNLNQRLLIQFSNVDDQSKLSASDFNFTPPEGVDLFYHEQ